MNNTTLSLRALFALAALFFLVEKQAVAQSDIAAFHRCGQTFITWTENPMAQQYRIYRAAQSISATSLGQAQKIATLGQGSGRHITEEWRNNGFYNTVQTRFVIEDLGAELPVGTGLCVWTTQPGEGGAAYYAITRVQDGVEILDIQSGVNSLADPLAEAVAEPCPVKVWQSADGLSAVFTQFVDIKYWNITYEGFAYNYAVMKPQGYNPDFIYPLCFDLHCWGCRYNPTLSGGAPFGLPVILVYPDDPGKTWWFGFSKAHQYRDQWPDANWGLPTEPAVTGPIVNYTEQRVLKIVDDLQLVGGYSFDPNKIYFWGNSMGGTGVLTLGSRYPDIVAAGYCSLPVTNFEVSHWQYDCAVMWGPTWLDLPVEIGGEHADHLFKYTGQSVWDWQNTQKQMRDRMADEMAYLCTAHGDEDIYVEWWNQGQPWYEQMQDSMRRGGSGWTQHMAGHDWMQWRGTGLNWGWLPNTGDQWKWVKNESFPAFSRFSGNSWTNHNINLQWASPANGSFPGTVTDTKNEWSILLELADHPQFASTFNKPLDSAWVDVTPRRLQNFKVETGKNYHWKWSDEATGAILAEGDFQPDGFGLLTVPQVLVKNSVRRLRIAPSGNPPMPCDAPAGFTAVGLSDSTANLSWDETPGAIGYLVSITNSIGGSTASIFTQTQPLLLNNLPPCVDFTATVQVVCSDGETSQPSATASFSTSCTPPPPCEATSSLSMNVLNDSTAALSWAAVAGAQGYLISYSKTGSADTTFLFTAENFLTVEGLEICADYSFSVLTACPNNSVSTDAFTVPISTGCPPQPCEKTTGIVFTDSTANALSLNWTAVAGASSFHVEHRKLGSTDWNLTATNLPALTVSGLDSCTEYEVRVRALCGLNAVGDWSDAFVAKTTNCTSATDEPAMTEAVEIYPNPSNGFVRITVKNNNFGNDAQLFVHDFLGKSCAEVLVRFDSQISVSLELGELPTGVYQLMLKDEAERLFSKKLVVIR